MAVDLALVLDVAPDASPIHPKVSSTAAVVAGHLRLQLPVKRNLTGTEVVYDGLIVDGNASNNTQFVVCDNITCTGEGSIVRNCTLLDAPDSGSFFHRSSSL